MTIEELKKKIEACEKSIERWEFERRDLKHALANRLSTYGKGDVLRKEGHNSGLWVVEHIGPPLHGLDHYILCVRKLNKDGKPGRRTAGFQSNWDLDQCSLVSKGDSDG